MGDDKKIQVFDNVKDAEEEHYKYLRKLTTAERAENQFRFLMSIHGEEIETPRRLGGVVEIIEFEER